ncbi:hypothetical protein B0J13DRAFT_548937 [Dactylonectria estremocensis]|uniref:C2H2-type domain-containing protein n=1 Tax=Dactylonectria estremocensis TaxID=1079267 RepID=A0A9P9J6A7_9HYPO|nr:hypothetical protein B0J13DRAFT_548937 [Dactylonectria estremocensis]
MAADTSQYTCPTCPASFTRREQLQRHSKSHSADRSFSCIFCEQSFNRRDVLKRHWQTCKARLDANLDIPVLTRLVRGKKRKACDHCVRLKRACNLTRPCQNCIEKELACSFSKAAGPELNQYEDASLPWQLELGDDGIFAPDFVDPQGSFADFFDDTASRPQLGGYFVSHTEPSQDEPRQPSLTHSSARAFTFDGDHLLKPDTLALEDFKSLGLVLNDLPSLPFLTKYTQSSSLAEIFECGSLSDRQQLVDGLRRRNRRSFGNAIFEQKFGQTDMEPPPEPGSDPIQCGPEVSFDPKLVDLGRLCPASQGQRCTAHSQTLAWARVGNDSQEAILEDSQADSSTSLDTAWVPETPLNLPFQTHEIVRMIKDITTFKPRRSKIVIEWSPVIENMCLQFFSPENLEKFLLLFWFCWYPNCPVMHKPTFSTETAWPGLVASMALIGACFSPEASDRLHANVWLNSVEELIFNDDVLHEESITISCRSAENEKEIWRRLEAVQAAYFLCVLQNWEGSKESKQNVRRHRYTSIIAIARDFGLSTVTLDQVRVEQFSDFNWNDFIFFETLIRTSIYVFLLDSSFVFFHNFPPRVMLPELDVDLACPDSCFQASSAEECFILLYDSVQSRRLQPSLRISEVIGLLCQPDYEHWGAFQNLSILNMFTIVTALHYLLFSYQTSLSYISQVSPADIGLWRWPWLWRQGDSELRLQSYPSLKNMWRRVGFFQHAPEYYMMTRLMLERWKSFKGTGHNAATCWLGMPPTRPSNRKYDEDEMVHVKELIQEFGGMTVE